MKDVLSRRSLLFGKSGLQGGEDVIRPPWSLAGEKFISACTGCAKCVEACPESILELDERKLAKVDFSKGECTFCRECVASCKDMALVILDVDHPWSLSVSIEGKCLTYKGVECRVCNDQCDPRAIRFQLNAGAVATPNLDQDLCTGSTLT